MLVHRESEDGIAHQRPLTLRVREEQCRLRATLEQPEQAPIEAERVDMLEGELRVELPVSFSLSALISEAPARLQGSLYGDAWHVEFTQAHQHGRVRLLRGELEDALQRLGGEYELSN